MEDPKRQAWMYLIAGVVAIVAAAFFLSIDPESDFHTLDWVILAGGAIAVWQGLRRFWRLRQGGSGDASAGGGTPASKGVKRIDPPNRSE